MPDYETAKGDASWLINYPKSIGISQPNSQQMAINETEIMRRIHVNIMRWQNECVVE